MGLGAKEEVSKLFFCLVLVGLVALVGFLDLICETQLYPSLAPQGRDRGNAPLYVVFTYPVVKYPSVTCVASTEVIREIGLIYN